MQVKGVTDKTPYSQQAVRRDHTEEVIFGRDLKEARKRAMQTFAWEQQMRRPGGESVLGMSEDFQGGQRGYSDK